MAWEPKHILRAWKLPNFEAGCTKATRKRLQALLHKLFLKIFAQFLTTVEHEVWKPKRLVKV